MQGGAGSSKGAVIEVAEAEGDGAAVRHRSSAEGVCKGAAERVQEDSGAHEHHIIQQAHKVRIASKWMFPGTTPWAVNHGRQDLLRGHGTLEDRLTGICDEAGLVGSGHTTTITQAVGKVSEAVWARGSKLSSNVSLKLVRLR